MHAAKKKHVRHSHMNISAKILNEILTDQFQCQIKMRTYHNQRIILRTQGSVYAKKSINLTSSTTYTMISANTENAFRKLIV